MMKYLTLLATFSLLGGCATTSRNVEPVQVCASRPLMVVTDTDALGNPVTTVGGMLCKKADGSRLILPYNKTDKFICRTPDDEQKLIQACIGE